MGKWAEGILNEERTDIYKLGTITEIVCTEWEI